MKAIHKYRVAASKGDREALRRIAQSQGYKTSIYDMPKMIALLKRAGIEIDGIVYDEDKIVNNTEFTDVPMPNKNLVGTIEL